MVRSEMLGGMKNVTRMAASRASRGAKLKSVKIIGRDEFEQMDVLELKKHVLDVGWGPEDDGANDDSDDSDDSDDGEDSDEGDEQG